MEKKVGEFTDYEIHDQYLKIMKLLGEKVEDLNKYGQRSYSVKIIEEAKKRGLV